MYDKNKIKKFKVIRAIIVGIANALFLTSIIVCIADINKRATNIIQILSITGFALALIIAVFTTIPKYSSFEGMYETGSHLETTISFSGNTVTSKTNTVTDYGGIPSPISFVLWVIFFTYCFAYGGFIFIIIDLNIEKIKTRLNAISKKPIPRWLKVASKILGVLLLPFGFFAPILVGGGAIMAIIFPIIFLFLGLY